ncbi:MAG: hypothetical protein IT457_13925 [Planctomycetes bacterium]|nr:hypothetical protein [Planctomycetota bacterium]
MVVSHLHVAGYRSVRDLDLRLSPVNVLVGADGCGQSKLYRTLQLLVEVVQGRHAMAFAEEARLPSTPWAGAPPLDPQSLAVAAWVDGMDYSLSCGLPRPGKYWLDPEVAGLHAIPSAIGRDPEVKAERVVRAEGRRLEFLARHGRRATLRDDQANASIARSYPTAARAHSRSSPNHTVVPSSRPCAPNSRAGVSITASRPPSTQPSVNRSSAFSRRSSPATAAIAPPRSRPSSSTANTVAPRSLGHEKRGARYSRF